MLQSSYLHSINADQLQDKDLSLTFGYEFSLLNVG